MYECNARVESCLLVIKNNVLGITPRHPKAVDSASMHSHKQAVDLHGTIHSFTHTLLYHLKGSMYNLGSNLKPHDLFRCISSSDNNRYNSKKTKAQI